MARGGIRPGAGRKKAGHTIEAEAARKRIVERVTKNVDSIVDAQLALAKGVSHLYRIDESGEGSKKRREHILVTDSEEIREFLNEHDGAAGTVNDSYYYISTLAPVNQAADSLLNRAYGKPQETVEHKGSVTVNFNE